jgi:hypothetical protein
MRTVRLPAEWVAALLGPGARVCRAQGHVEVLDDRDLLGNRALHSATPDDLAS